MPSDDDIDLMQRIALGDQAALAALYRRYAGLVYSIALRVLQNPVLAEEALQDTFIKVWREPRKWNPEGGRLVNWLVTVARFTAIDRLRKERRQPPLAMAALEDYRHLSDDAEGFEDLALFEAQAVQQFLHRLPAAQLEVIQLAFWYGMTHTEISRHLAVPLGTVKSRLQLGMQKLREMARQRNSRPGERGPA
jgi:RNA polymerase sigma-70 factor, ECF subfamily